MCRIWRPPRNSIFVRSKLLLQVISLWLIFTLRIDVYALRDLMGHCYVHFAFLFTLRCACFRYSCLCVGACACFRYSCLCVGACACFRYSCICVGACLKVCACFRYSCLCVGACLKACACFRYSCICVTCWHRCLRVVPRLIKGAQRLVLMELRYFIILFRDVVLN